MTHVYSKFLGRKEDKVVMTNPWSDHRTGLIWDSKSKRVEARGINI